MTDQIRFIDLFSGIGGFRLGLEKTNFEFSGGSGQSLDNNKGRKWGHLLKSDERQTAIRDDRGLERANRPQEDQLPGSLREARRIVHPSLGTRDRRHTPDRGALGIGGLGLEKANKESWKSMGEQPTGGKDIRSVRDFSNSEVRGSNSSDNQFECVWSNDFNKYASQIYTKNFGEENHVTADIRGINPENIPDFDLLCAGFPCQAFSVAGKRKGFKETRGTLFFEILRIAKAKRPRLLLLENVKGLLNHDGGRMFTIILQALDELGYWVEWQVLNSKHYGVPQNRERVFIVGHLRGAGGREIFPIGSPDGLDSREAEGSQEQISTAIDANYYKGPDKHGQRTIIIDYFNRSIREDDVINTLKTNQGSPSSSPTILHNIYGGFKEGIRTFEHYSPTITTAKGGGHLPSVLKDSRIRRLTPTECERLQGFSDGWTKWGYLKGSTVEYEDIYGYKTVKLEELDYYCEPQERKIWTVIDRKKLHTPLKDTVQISDTQRYKCLGNAITTNVVKHLGILILKSFKG